MGLANLFGVKTSDDMGLYMGLRNAKAVRVGDLIDSLHPLKDSTVLDVGAGSGLIAEYLAGRVGEKGSVLAADVDNWIRTDKVEFLQLDGTKLPLPSASTDIALSNHVIEHVGDGDDQKSHLAEIFRVLRSGGLLYIAQPNRWSLFEPHFKLPLLSWWPIPLRTPYLRFLKRIGFAKPTFNEAVPDEYLWRPLSHRQLKNLLAEAGFVAQPQTLQTIRTVAATEVGGSLGALISRLPDWLLLMVRPLAPTLVFTAVKPG